MISDSDEHCQGNHEREANGEWVEEGGVSLKWTIEEHLSEKVTALLGS